MPSADFCSAVRSPFDNLSRRSDAEQISWGKLNRLPCTAAGSTLGIFRWIWASRYVARSSHANALYPVLVHRLAHLFPASFRPRLAAVAPCTFTSPSPPSGWAEDFHLQTAEHAQHTTKPLPVVAAQNRRSQLSGTYRAVTGGSVPWACGPPIVMKNPPAANAERIWRASGACFSGECPMGLRPTNSDEKHAQRRMPGERSVAPSVFFRGVSHGPAAHQL